MRLEMLRQCTGSMPVAARDPIRALFNPGALDGEVAFIFVSLVKSSFTSRKPNQMPNAS